MPHFPGKIHPGQGGQGKGGLGQGAQGDGEEEGRVVIRRDPVGAEGPAGAAAVDERPLAPLRTHTPTGSIIPRQVQARSPGSSSTWRLDRQWGQWLRCRLAAPSGVTSAPQALQEKDSPQGWRR